MIKGINHITFSVSNVDISFVFYSGILCFKPVARWEHGAYLTAGDTWIALNQDSNVTRSHKPDYSHTAFSCDSSEFESLRSRLINYGCEEWSENESEGESFYFLDPDGNKLEIHVGDLQSRIEDMKKNSGDRFVFYI